MANALAVGTLGLLYFEYKVDDTQLLQALGHWLVYLQLVKYFLPKTAEDDWFLFLLGLDAGLDRLGRQSKRSGRHLALSVGDAGRLGSGSVLSATRGSPALSKISRRSRIRLGRYPVGELLPTETELMARHSASRQTVREALRILMDQGLIVRRAGLGSVIIATDRLSCSPTASSRSANGCAIPTRPTATWSPAATSSPTASSRRC